jgi:glutathione S-transferase
VLDAEGRDPKRTFVPFAPPILVCGDVVLSHTAFILYWLAPRVGLAPGDEAGRNAAHQLQLTITDFLAETHDVHHPIAVRLYYEDQKAEASRRSGHFTRERMPKFLGYFERLLERNERAGAGPHIMGDEFTYLDTSLFQVMAGLRYAFPNNLERLKHTVPRLNALVDRVAARPGIAAYLASPRRIPFNQHGLFRSYPELDPTGDAA